MTNYTTQTQAAETLSVPDETPTPTPTPDHDEGNQFETLQVDQRAVKSLTYQTPPQQWLQSIAPEKQTPTFDDLEPEAFQRFKVNQGQNHRNALYDEDMNDIPIPHTEGPLQLPESFDPVVYNEPNDQYIGSQTDLETNPNQSAYEILNKTVKDAAMIGHVLTARMRVSIGYLPDEQLILQYKELCHSLSKLHYVVRPSRQNTPDEAAPVKKTVGRPRKNAQKSSEGGGN